MKCDLKMAKLALQKSPDNVEVQQKLLGLLAEHKESQSERVKPRKQCFHCTSKKECTLFCVQCSMKTLPAVVAVCQHHWAIHCGDRVFENEDALEVETDIDAPLEEEDFDWN